MENTNSGNGKIIIVGDLFPVPSNFDLFSKGDIQTLFGKEICDLFASADYRICNLEGALTDCAGKREKTGPVLYAPTATINGLKKIGIDCCTLANNHMTDAGHEGVVDTMKTLDANGIVHIGAGGNCSSIRTMHEFQIAGKKIGLYNVAETIYNEPTAERAGVNLYDEYLVCKDIERLKEKCDYLIVVYHGGSELFRYPSPQTKRRFHRMADSGANMVLSQHTHCVGCEEHYNGAYLLYGQGNFLFRSFNNEFTDTGLIVELRVEHDEFKVHKHLVRAGGDTVRYDEGQNFEAFNERSSNVNDDAFVSKLFDAYCEKRLRGYFESYRGKVYFRRVLAKFMPRLYRRIVMDGYTRKQKLLILHSLRSEQNREIVMTGLKNMLYKDGDPYEIRDSK